MALPPGPRFAAWQTFNWVTRPYEFLDECAARYGDPFTVDLAGIGKVVMVSHPDAIKDIFLGNADQLRAGAGNHFLRPVLGDHSILVMDGAPHKRHRQLIAPAFHGERMRAYGDVILRNAREHLTTWKAGETLSVHPTMQGITLDVILHAVFGVGDHPDFQRYRRLLGEALDAMGSATLFVKLLQTDLGPLSPWGRYQRAARQLDEMLNAEFARRRAEGLAERQDILSMMMGARDDAGEPMTDQELREEAFTLLAAGHDTTATALAWAIHWIHATPGVLEKLRDELASLGESPAPEAVARNAYLDAVCQETLRIYPVVPIVARRVMSPYSVMGHEVPVGCSVAPCIYLTHRRPDLYPQPTVFRPERFLERKLSPYEHLPFGGGIRRCIGSAFALYEIKLVLAEIVRRFDLTLAGDGEPRAVRRSVTLAPRDGTRVRVEQVHA